MKFCLDWRAFTRSSQDRADSGPGTADPPVAGAEARLSLLSFIGPAKAVPWLQNLSDRADTNFSAACKGREDSARLMPGPKRMGKESLSRAKGLESVPQGLKPALIQLDLYRG
jgi:hypothetical protein